MTTDTLTWDWREQPDLDALAGMLARYGVTLEQVDTGTDQYEVRIDGSAPEVTALIEAARELRDAWQELSAPGLMSPAVRDAVVARADAAERAVVTAADAFDQPAEVTAHRFVWRPWRVQDGPPDTHTTAGTAQTVPEPPSDEAIAASYLATAHRRVAALEAQVRAVAGLCQHWAGAPEGDRVELREVTQTMRTCIVRAGGEDPLAVWAEPADAPAVEPQGGRTGGNPNPGTPDSGTAILGRGWLDADGDFWRWLTREEAEEGNGGPVREALLVSPAAGRVLEAVERWRNSPEAWHAARDDDERELIAAVDAMVGDRPAEPAEGFLTGLTAAESAAHRRRLVETMRVSAEPAPEPDSGPGWDRKAYDQLLHELRDQHLDGYADQVERVFGALLADRDQLGGQIKRLADCIIENVPGEPSQSQGAVDTAIRLLETLGYHRKERDAARAEAERLRAGLEAARTATVGLAAGLETARRDGAADALEWWAKRHGDHRRPSTRELIAEMRAGTRAIPATAPATHPGQAAATYQPEREPPPHKPVDPTLIETIAGCLNGHDVPLPTDAGNQVLNLLRAFNGAVDRLNTVGEELVQARLAAGPLSSVPPAGTEADRDGT